VIRDYQVAPHITHRGSRITHLGSRITPSLVTYHSPLIIPHSSLHMEETSADLRLTENNRKESADETQIHPDWRDFCLLCALTPGASYRCRIRSNWSLCPSGQSRLRTQRCRSGTRSDLGRVRSGW